MHGLEAEYYDRIDFTYLDIDDPTNDQFKRALGYQYQPHLFLLDGDGNILGQWVGRTSAEVLVAAFNAASP